jgi:hypothetical protein
MAFMQKQISEKQTWFAVDGNCGIDYIPTDVVGGHVAPVGTVYTDEVTGFEDLCARAKDYTSNTSVTEITVVEGYGARLSAPGYMDRTEWTVHETEAEASEYLDETYPDEDEDEDESDE